MSNDVGNEKYIKETNLESNLGVIVSNDLKWRGHVGRMLGVANRTLGMIKRTFSK